MDEIHEDLLEDAWKIIQEKNAEIFNIRTELQEMTKKMEYWRDDQNSRVYSALDREKKAQEELERILEWVSKNMVVFPKAKIGQPDYYKISSDIIRKCALETIHEETP